MSKLTALSVKAAKLPGRYVDGRGLMLVVKPSGSRFWVLRIQSNGVRRDIGLGSFNEIGLLDARERAVEARKLVRRGIDPSAARRASTGLLESPTTFREAAQQAHDDLSVGWKNRKHANQWIKTLESYAFPTLGDLPVNSIDAAAIISAIRPIWLTHEETSRRVRQRICAVLDWASAKGLRSSECPKAAIGKGLPRQKDGKKHHLALPYSEAPKLMRALVKSEPVARLALRFLILTAARTGEVLGATWSEIDMKNGLWTVPASRMKAGKEHVVPLSTSAMAILKVALQLRTSDDPNEFVFPSSHGHRLSDAALLKALHAQGRKVTVHGFRSTFRDWAAEKTTVGDAVAEAALAHTNKNRVEAAYRRTNYLEKRAVLMQSWADYLSNGQSTHS